MERTYSTDTYKRTNSTRSHKLWWMEKCDSNVRNRKGIYWSKGCARDAWLSFMSTRPKMPLTFVILSKIYDYDRSGCSLACCLFLFHAMNSRIYKTTITHTICAALLCNICGNRENKREHIYEIVFILQNHISISTFRVVFLLLLLLLLFFILCLSCSMR